MSPTIKEDDISSHNALRGPVWLSIVKADPPRIHTLRRTSQDTPAVFVRTQLETTLVTKDYTSQSAYFLVDLARHHSNRTRRWTGVRGKYHNGRWEHKIRFLSYVPRVMLDICVQATWWIVDNDESGSVTATLIIFCFPVFTVAQVDRISAVVYPFLPASSNHRIALTQTSSDCSICLTNLFQSDRTTCFTLWHLFVMCKNPSVRHYYSSQNATEILTIRLRIAPYKCLLNAQFRYIEALDVHSWETKF